MTIINNTTQDNIFGLFPQYTLGQANSSVKNTAENKKIKSDVYNTDINNKTKISKKKKIIFGSTIASTILTVGIFSMLFAKGIHGSFLKKLSKYTEDITSQSGNINQKAIYYTKKSVKKAINTMQACSNFTAIKDWISDKIFKANKITKKFAQSSYNLFKRITDKTLGKHYDKVEINVNNLTSLLKNYNTDSLSNITEADKLQKITIKGVTHTLEEWINIISKQNQRLQSNFENSFSLGARRIRDNKRQSLLSDLPQKIGERFFKDKNSIFNTSNYKNYATEDLSKSAQAELRSEIMNAKKQISNNISNIYEQLRTNLNSINDNILPKDEVTEKSIKQLKILLDNFRKCSGSNETAAREKISSQISELTDNIIQSIESNEAYSQNVKSDLLKYLSSIKDTVSTSGINSKGAVEEIMTILKGLNGSVIESTGKKVVSDNSYKEFSKLASKISTGLKDATELEAGEYFLKQAELKVGSAPTDVLSVLFPIGAGTYSIAKGEDKDEKISATLTTCIPLVGSFATFVYGTTKMLSGAKNLAFTFVSGVILSRLGNYADKLYKKYKKSGSVADVVKEEYDNFWTGLTPQYAEPLKTNTDSKK